LNFPWTETDRKLPKKSPAERDKDKLEPEGKLLSYGNTSWSEENGQKCDFTSPESDQMWNCL